MSNIHNSSDTGVEAKNKNANPSPPSPVEEVDDDNVAAEAASSKRFPKPKCSSIRITDVGFLSRYLTYFFVWPLVRFSQRSDRPMDVHDLWLLDDDETVRRMAEQFDQERRKQWGEAINHQRREDCRKRSSDGGGGGKDDDADDDDEASLLSVEVPFYSPLFKLSRGRVIAGGVLILAKVVSEVFLPLLSRQILLSIQSQDFYGLYYVFGFIALMIVGQVCNQLHFRTMELAANRMRAVCNYCLYRKALELRACEAAMDMSSQVVTLVASDSQRLVDVASQFHLLWASPIQIALGTYFMYLFLGFPSFAAVGLMLTLYPVSYKISAVQAGVRRKLLVSTEERVRRISEFVQGVRVVKMYGWEPFLRCGVHAVRAVELSYLTLELMLWTLLSTMLILAPQIAIMVTFIIYIYTNGSLRASDAFAALSMLNLLKFPVLYFGSAIMMTSQAKVGCERMQKFLNRRVASDAADISAVEKQQGGGETTDDVTQCHEPLSGGGAPSTKRNDDGDGVVASPPGDDQEPDLVVDIRNVCVQWNRTASSSAFVRSDKNIVTSTTASPTNDFTFNIKQLTLQVRIGEVCAVVGPVGSGKSLLCTALIGEAHVFRRSSVDHSGGGEEEEVHRVQATSSLPASTSGSFYKCPSVVAYAAQEPYLMSGTVRDNILFFSPYDEGRYRAVLTACELWADFAIYPDGEMTMVGERGVTLSGGQKARLALARAVYASNRVRLTVLDDPFSALDARTGAAIVDALLHPQHGMLRHQAVVIVTHARQNLAVAQRVVELHEGHPHVLDLQGIEGVSPSNLIDVSCLQDLATEEDEEAAIAASPMINADNDEAVRAASGSQHQHPPTTAPDDNTGQQQKQTGEALSVAKTTDALYLAETSSATVSIWTYWDYFRFGGGMKYFITVLLTLGIERCCFVGCDVWLTIWTSAAAGPPTNSIGIQMGFPSGADTAGAKFYMKVYVVLVFVVLAMVLGRLGIFGFGGYHSSKNLFGKAFESLTRCPMSFFDTTPTGRVLNRMSHDVERVGFPLITQMNSMVASAGWMFTGLAVTVAVAPINLAVIIPSIVGVGICIYYYRPLNVHLQRLDATSRSAMQSLLFESVHGAATIRSFQRGEAFLEHFSALVDDSTRTLYAVTVAQRWVSMRAEALGTIIACFVCLLMWILRYSVSAGMAGMAIVWGMSMSRSVSFTITDGIQAQAKLVSVERLVEFVEKLPQEPSRRTDKDPIMNTDEDNNAMSEEEELANKMANEQMLVAAQQQQQRKPGRLGLRKGGVVSFPTRGTIEFVDVRMRYRPSLPLVLDGCSFSITAGERVGVVGRTGSGKSSLIVALYRLRELESGVVHIDGQNIFELGLDMLRGGRMAIIPQDPVLFSGTVRSNVDPHNQASDSDVQQALEAVTLWRYVETLGGTAAVVEDRGKNFSVGQRQLVCIARALLTRPVILIMDEATANVDHETDVVIQHAVRSFFKYATVVEVAHRLHTVMDTDRVLVMQFGKVLEFDTPWALLEDEQRYHVLRDMVNATGPAVSKELREIALSTRDASKKAQ